MGQGEYYILTSLTFIVKIILLLLRPGKVDPLFLISHFLNLQADWRSLLTYSTHKLKGVSMLQSLTNNTCLRK